MKKKLKAAILAASFTQMGTNAISPIISDLNKAFPEAGLSKVQFLMTFPSLFVIFFSFFSALLSKVIPKRMIAAAGCFLFALSGIFSWSFHTAIDILFLWAAIMGTGIGLIVPMTMSLIADCYSGNEKQALMGWQSSAANVGAMIMTFLGGYLALLHWSFNYLVYLIAVPGLVLSLMYIPKDIKTFFSPEAPQSIEKPAQRKKKRVWHAFFNKSLIGYCLTAFAITMLFNVLPTNLSISVTEKGIGTSGETGTAVAMLLMGGAVGGFLYGELERKFKGFVMILGFAVLTVTFLITAAARNIGVIYIMCLAGGSSISFVMPYTLVAAAEESGNQSSVSSAMIMASSNLGAFLTPCLTLAVSGLSGRQDSSALFCYAAAIGAAVIALLFCCLCRSPKGCSCRRV